MCIRDRLCVGWPARDDDHPAKLGVKDEQWAAELVALAAIAKALGGSPVSLYADRESGSIALIVAGHERPHDSAGLNGTGNGLANGPAKPAAAPRTLARVLRGDNSTDAAWRGSIARAVAETQASIGQAADPGVISVPMTDFALLLSGSTNNRTLPGAPAEANWQGQFGIAYGALLCSLDSDPAAASLAALRADAVRERRSPVVAALEWCAVPRNTALVLCLLLPVKTMLYYAIVVRFGLRARTSLFTSLNLASFSEFGLIVAALGVAQGWLSVDWLMVIAIAVSVSFAIASPFSTGSENAYQQFKRFWDRFQKAALHPDDQILESGGAKVLVIGMGRVGSGAYDELTQTWPDQVLGIEHIAEKAERLRAQGRNVKVGDATDTDFWNAIRAAKPKDLIVLAMPNHHSNMVAAQQIRNVGLTSQVVAIAKFDEEVQALAELNVTAFNMYSKAGSGLARHALEKMGGVNIAAQ